MSQLIPPQPGRKGSLLKEISGDSDVVWSFMLSQDLPNIRWWGSNREIVILTISVNPMIPLWPLPTDQLQKVRNLFQPWMHA